MDSETKKKEETDMQQRLLWRVNFRTWGSRSTSGTPGCLTCILLITARLKIIFTVLTLSLSDQCTVTRSYLFLHKFWFFSTIYYFGNWAFIGVSPRMWVKCHLLWGLQQNILRKNLRKKKRPHTGWTSLIVIKDEKKGLYDKNFRETTAVRHLI